MSAPTALTYTIDTTPLPLTLALHYDSGGDGDSDDDEMVGTAAPNADIWLKYQNGSVTITPPAPVVADSSGNFSFFPPDTYGLNGPNTITATEFSAANVAATATLTYDYEPNSPPAPI